MGNIKNYYFNKIDARVSNSDYWDFYLAGDSTSMVPQDSSLVVHYDFNNEDIFTTGTTSSQFNIQYSVEYGRLVLRVYDVQYQVNYGEILPDKRKIFSTVVWKDAVAEGGEFTTLGLTGIDNGLITYTRHSADTTNIALLYALTGSTLNIPSGDTRLCLTSVTGNTYSYDISHPDITTSVGDYVNLCGGFYQGYYKLDGNDYEVLPNRVKKGWMTDIWLKPDDTICSGKTGTILNDVYPDNEGFFLYFGTRAENKFWNIFEGLNTGCTSGCTIDSGCTDTLTTYCTPHKETDIILSNGVPLSPPPIRFDEISNQFLIYNQGKSGHTVNTIDQGTNLTATTVITSVMNETNPFLVYKAAGAGNNSNCGSGDTSVTAKNFSGFTAPLEELDKDADIIDNALGFRIKNDGSIGYRLLKMTSTCSGDTTVTGVTIEEAYSDVGMVKAYEWSYVAIRFVADQTYDDEQLRCGNTRKGKLMFYVNGNLKFVVNDFDEFIARRLNEFPEKQVAVPFNISIGGGSQGLLENQTFDGPDPDDIGCNIEKYFAGSFIGSISQFRMTVSNSNYCEINDIFESERDRYMLSREEPITDRPPLGILYGNNVNPSILAINVDTLEKKVVPSGINVFVSPPAGGGYIYWLVPVEFTQPSDFVDSDSGCIGFNLPYVTQGTIIVNNDEGVVEYHVYRTFNVVNGLIDVWMCE